MEWDEIHSGKIKKKKRGCKPRDNLFSHTSGHGAFSCHMISSCGRTNRACHAFALIFMFVLLVEHAGQFFEEGEGD